MPQVFSLPHSTPEAQGIPSTAISSFVSAVEHDIDSLHSFILMRHGLVVAEGWWDPYRSNEQHVLFSLSKSFTSTAIGLLVAEGRLSADDLVLGFFPDKAPAQPGANLRAMRVRHLLSMSTGHTVDTLLPVMLNPDMDWVECFLAQPVEHEPGIFFLYNTGASYVLSAIVQKLTGGRMLDYLRPRLFEPLGISNPHWESSPQGIDTGGWGLSLTTTDIAAFGQLYLQNGLWKGARLLPQAWVAQATSKQVSNGSAPSSDWEQGYGYQFWRCTHDSYRGDGAFGQYCLVMPAQQAVLAITSGLGEMQPPLDLVWEHLLPAFGDAPLPENAPAQSALTHQLAALQLRTPQGAAHTTAGAQVSGRSFVIDENKDGIKEIRFDFGEQQTLVTIWDNQGEQRVACGCGSWLRSPADLAPTDKAARPIAPQTPGPWQIAASGAWTEPSTFTVKLWWTATPFARTLTCRFMGEHLEVEQQPNLSFGPIEVSWLHGTAQ